VTRISAILSRLSAWNRQRTCRIVDFGPIADAVYAVGDVHGCRDALSSLLDLIQADARSISRTARIVLLGDMVDRGQDPAGVIDLISLPRYRADLDAILGNHERLMLDFVREPHRHAEWLDLGGFETLRSYGLSLSRTELEAVSRRRARQIMDAHIPDAHLNYLDSLPHGFSMTVNGVRYMLTHAGYDETVASDCQTEQTLLWGRGGTRGSDDLRLVQGHVIVERPDPSATLVCVDTGAWKTGTLTCLRLCEDLEPALLSVNLPVALMHGAAK
jgi:serine/threonine protein phosphatase 1